MAVEVERLHSEILLRINEGGYGAAAATALPPYALPTPRTWSAPASRRSSFDIADGVAGLELGFAFGCGGGGEEEEDDEVCGLAATAERAAWATLASPTPRADDDDDGWAMPGAAGPASDFEMMSSAAMGFSRDLEAELCGLRTLGAASRVRRSASLGSAASFYGGTGTAASSSFSTPSCSQGSSPTSVLAQSGAWDAAMDAARPRDAKTASHGKPSRDRRSARPRAAAGGGSAHSSSTVLPLRRTSSCRQDAVPSTGTGVFIPRSTQLADPALVQRKPACPVLLPAHIVDALKLNVQGRRFTSATAGGAEMTFKVIGNKGARSCARH
eukprot:SM000217S06845  [mRNA]  locus=s217:162305:163627:+ [translate_table: standard]